MILRNNGIFEKMNINIGDIASKVIIPLSAKPFLELLEAGAQHEPFRSFGKSLVIILSAALESLGVQVTKVAIIEVIRSQASSLSDDLNNNELQHAICIIHEHDPLHYQMMVVCTIATLSNNS